MGLILRQSFKSSIAAYIGVTIGAINTLFISTKFLSPDELATLRLLLENSMIYSAFAHLGVSSIGDKFFPHFNDNTNKHNGFLSFMLLFPIIGFILFYMVYNYYETNIENYFIKKSANIIPYLRISLPMTLTWIYISIFDTYCRLNQRIAIPTFIREVFFRVLNIATILIYGFGFIDFRTFLYLNVGTLILMLLTFIIYVKKIDKLYLNLDFKKWNSKLFRQVLMFGSLTILTGIGSNLFLFLDRNIIASNIGTTAVAIFTIAFFIASIIEIPSKSIKLITVPFLSQAIFENDKQKIAELYQKSANNLLIVGGLIYLIIFATVDEILFLIPNTEVYSQGKYVILILGLTKWIEISFGMNLEMINYSKFYFYNTIIILLVTILAIVGNYILIPQFGIIGSAIATGGVALIGSLIRMIIINFKYVLSPFTKASLKSIIVFLILIGSTYFLPNFTSNKILCFLSIASKSIIYSSIIIFAIIKLNLSIELKGVVLTSFKKLLKTIEKE